MLRSVLFIVLPMLVVSSEQMQEDVSVLEGGDDWFASMWGQIGEKWKESAVKFVEAVGAGGDGSEPALLKWRNETSKKVKSILEAATNTVEDAAEAEESDQLKNAWSAAATAWAVTSAALQGGGVKEVCNAVRTAATAATATKFAIQLLADAVTEAAKDGTMSDLGVSQQATAWANALAEWMVAEAESVKAAEYVQAWSIRKPGNAAVSLIGRLSTPVAAGIGVFLGSGSTFAILQLRGIMSPMVRDSALAI
eukprot:gnl/MRDRNA2_/MRDRNA2_34793_c0_seq1.p1 gnl/MRDRNA2_/MRDRNA2_34793_c0~~gnl/MRDRNA2_/MRDRNA2_34793_c0_seq1.p1  ORF type:complete len:252 (-),score=54.96 gnl/MRDRNA2_/MRDRNA2_34793_c0_seq1:28-783(-)